MKAIVKATGEIIDGSAMVSFNGDDFYLNELEVIQDDSEKTLYDELDEVYWANMKHQFAGMAMQGFISNSVFFKEVDHVTNGKPENLIAAFAINISTALVEKLKEESNGN